MSLRSADSQTVNFVPSEVSICTVSLGLVSTVVTDLKIRRKYGVILRQCLPCEKQAFQCVNLFFCFSSSWIYSKVNSGVGCHNKHSPGF